MNRPRDISEATSRIGQPYVTDSTLPVLRPKDAASLILLDRGAARPRFLVGKRGKGHAFMPDLYVFPGGRRDRSDSRIPIARPFRPEVISRLMRCTGAAMTRARARALGVTAIRETMEETGLVIGARGDVGSHPDWQRFAGEGIAPDLSTLRYIARATTPPRQNRRFDTRFFACFIDEIGASPEMVSDSRELHDLTWIGFDEVGHLSVPRITQIVLNDLREELAHDPDLAYGRPVPYYLVRRGIFERIVL